MATKQDGETVTPLRRARMKAGIASAVIARESGLHLATITRIERGLQCASPDVAAGIVRALRRLGISGVTEMQILYPQRYRRGVRAAAAEG
jgi:predicted transcriptional regulator